MSLCCECCVLSGGGFCVVPITLPGESYRVCCVYVWLWGLNNEKTLAHWGCRVVKKYLSIWRAKHCIMKTNRTTELQARFLKTEGWNGFFFSAPTALSARNKLQILNIHFSWDAKASRHSKEGFLFLDCLILMMEEKYSVEKSKNFKLIYLVDKSKFKGTAKPNTR